MILKHVSKFSQHKSEWSLTEAVREWGPGRGGGGTLWSHDLSSNHISHLFHGVPAFGSVFSNKLIDQFH